MNAGIGSELFPGSAKGTAGLSVHVPVDYGAAFVVLPFAAGHTQLYLGYVVFDVNTESHDGLAFLGCGDRHLL